MVFAYEGLQPTSEASDKKLTSWTGEEKDALSRSWATQVQQRRKTLEREGARRPEIGRPGNPMILEEKLEHPHLEDPVRDVKMKGR